MSALIQLNIAELLRGVKSRQQARTSAASSESPFVHARSTTPFGFIWIASVFLLLLLFGKKIENCLSG
jgi:hypothetical protein